MLAYYFTHQSHPFAHLTTFRRLQNSLSETRLIRNSYYSYRRRKFMGRAGSPFNTKSPGLRPTSIPSGILIHAAIWPQQIWAENWVGAVPFGGAGAGFPSNTMWPGPSPTCVPSFILIRPTVWPQCTNVTDRQDRQRTDSIGRTVLQTVAQKLAIFE